ncbi:unnamed protein product, partial [Phaedon cochleariae]
YVCAFSEMSIIIHGIIRSSSLFANRPGLASLLTQTKQFWNIHQLAISTEEKTYQKAFLDRTRHIFFFHLTFSVVTTFYISFSSLFSALTCYRPSWLPIYALWSYQVLVMQFAVLLPIVCFDTLLMTFISLTYLQFRLLNRQIETMMDADTASEIQEKICEVVDHHVFLINPDLGAIFKSGVYVYVALSGFIIIYSIPTQHLKDEAANVTNTAYSTKWYGTPEFGTSVLMMMANGRRYVKISAGSLIDINLQTSLATIKTMVSYCMFLRTVGLDQQEIHEY